MAPAPAPQVRFVMDRLFTNAYPIWMSTALGLQARLPPPPALPPTPFAALFPHSRCARIRALGLLSLRAEPPHGFALRRAFLGAAARRAAPLPAAPLRSFAAARCGDAHTAVLSGRCAALRCAALRCAAMDKTALCCDEPSCAALR